MEDKLANPTGPVSHNIRKPGADLVCAEDARRFCEEGVVCLRGLFERQWLDQLASGIEDNLMRPGPQAQFYTSDEDKGFFFADHAVWQDIEQYRNFVLHSPAAEIAGRLMDANQVNLFFDNLMVKDAGTPARSPWHQDVPYWPIEGDQMCTVWLTLDPVPKENSPEFVRGSHRWGKAYKPLSFYEPESEYDERPEALEVIPDIESNRDQYELLSFEMAPGDVLAFDGHVIHGAPGNTTNTRRLAFATRWAGETMTYAIRAGHMHPTFPHCGLRHGDPLGGTTFPVVWRRHDTHLSATVRPLPESHCRE